MPRASPTMVRHRPMILQGGMDFMASARAENWIVFRGLAEFALRGWLDSEKWNPWKARRAQGGRCFPRPANVRGAQKWTNRAAAFPRLPQFS